MPRLDQPGAGVRMLPFLDLAFIFMSDDVFHFQTLRPGKGEGLFRRLEVIGDVALPADVAAHLRPRGVAVDVVVWDPLGRLQDPDAFDEGRPRYPQLHVL